MKRAIVILSAAVIVAGCSEPLTTREKGALAGGAIGAGTGAAIGHSVGHTGAGAVIGGAVGAVSGAVIGDAMQANERKAAQVPPPPTAVAVAPAPPVVTPASPPSMVWVPEWNMYVLEGYDMVYYSNAYYYYSGGHWWVSQSYGGPWALVLTPPGMIAKLPPGQLHSHIPAGQRGGFCPPGLAKQGRC